MYGLRQVAGQMAGSLAAGRVGIPARNVPGTRSPAAGPAEKEPGMTMPAAGPVKSFAVTTKKAGASRANTASLHTEPTNSR